MEPVFTDEEPESTVRSIFDIDCANHRTLICVTSIYDVTLRLNNGCLFQNRKEVTARASLGT